jgi:citrate synthase
MSRNAVMPVRHEARGARGGDVMDGEGRWIGRREALERLGIKTQTLYAYVSRGRITARPDPGDPRRSLYAVQDIERLIRGEAPAMAPDRAAARGEAELLSALSTVFDGRLLYRGEDAIDLADHATLEAVTCRLWVTERNPFTGIRPRVDLFSAGPIRSRVFATLARRASEAPSAEGRDLDALVDEAAGALNEVFDAASGPGPRSHFHQRLARGWKMVERDAHLIRRALVLCADGRMNSAVLATRTAAAGGASVAGAALAGLTTLAASDLVERTNRAVAFVVQARFDRAAAPPEEAPDPDWPDGDPRGEAMLATCRPPWP